MVCEEEIVPIQETSTEPVETHQQSPSASRLKHLGSRAAALLSLPLLLPFLITSSRRIIREDAERWTEALGMRRQSDLSAILKLLGTYPEFRSLYFYRLRRGNAIGVVASLGFRVLFKPQATLYLETPTIEPGLFLQHAFSTIVSAKSIGRDCWINQQVTVGFKDGTHGPIIGDNVTINAGAKVLGPIRVGNNVIVGANAVVLKDVPDNCVVVGAPAYIVRRGGVKTREYL
jgi:serine O-acetyltransferase